MFQWLVIVVLAGGIVGLAIHSSGEIERAQRIVNQPEPPKPSCVSEFWSKGVGDVLHTECNLPRRIRALDNIGNSFACECPEPKATVLAHPGVYGNINFVGASREEADADWNRRQGNVFIRSGAAGVN